MSRASYLANSIYGQAACGHVLFIAGGLQMKLGATIVVTTAIMEITTFASLAVVML
jgi:hypothetical protein